MKQRMISFISIFVLMAVMVVTPVLAQDEDGRTGIYHRATSTPVKVRSDVIMKIEARRASTTERRAEMRDKMEERKASSTERRMEIKNNIEQRKASSTERRAEMQINLAKRKAEHVTKVLLATIERLEKIITRIESRIEKIQERGGNTTEAKGFIEAAEENLADARVAVGTFANLDLSGSTLRENFETVRAAAAEAKEHIRTAHRNMMMAVRTLKGPNTGLDGGKKATSTATSTSDSDD